MSARASTLITWAAWIVLALWWMRADAAPPSQEARAQKQAEARAKWRADRRERERKFEACALQCQAGCRPAEGRKS